VPTHDNGIRNTGRALAPLAVSWSLPITFNKDMLPLVRAEVAGQSVMLVFDTSTPSLAVFVRESGACVPAGDTPCYSQTVAFNQKTLKLCKDNERRCLGGADMFQCKAFMPESDVQGQKIFTLFEHLSANGLSFNESFLEGLDHVTLSGVALQDAPVRLIYRFEATDEKAAGAGLYGHVSGFLGAAGRELSCRKTTVWGGLLARIQTKVVSLDFALPGRSWLDTTQSKVVFDSTPGQSSVFPDLIWSEPKQLGDYLDAGRHEFLMYHIKVCNVDMLYNTSSNWLAVLLTGSPCLVLPPFLFDRLMTRIPVTCPFKSGERANGRLCRPNRSSGAKVTLPALSFRMNDTQGLGSRSDLDSHNYLPLERLVFEEKNEELLCIARADDEKFHLADMPSAYIGLGALAVRALQVAIDLPGRRIGLANKGDVFAESTNLYCTPSINCSSAMQVYYPPSNVCLDPDCSKYMFMTLDNYTKTCIWNPSLRYILVIILVTLGVLDILGHKLYKSAMYKARDPHGSQRNL